jgi:CDP-diacylglycerol---glycerol-3-phosphate 3-phosphatidyltransferase
MSRNLPNIITISRGLLTVLMAAIWLSDLDNKYLFVLIIFWLAAISDFFDGWLARKLKSVSPLGSVLDPLFDKILTFTLFLLVFEFAIVPKWMIIVLFLRDIVIDALRSYQYSRGISMPAIMTAKLKTNCQFLMLNFIVLVLAFPAWPYFAPLAYWFGSLAVAFSLWSGTVYAYRVS